MKTHPKKSTLLEQYLKRNQSKPERTHVNRNFTPQDQLTLTSQFERTFQPRSNRCKLREEQEERTKNPRPHSKKVTQPNFSFNVTSIFKNEDKFNRTQTPYRSLRKTNYKNNNLDNAKDIIFSKYNDKYVKNNKKKEKIIPTRIKRLKFDHVKELIPDYSEKNSRRNEKNIPTYPHKVPYKVILQGIKENQQALYAI